MSKYERPVVMTNDDLAEGVFLASGDTNNNLEVEIFYTPGPTGFIIHANFINKGSEPFELKKFVLTFNTTVTQSSTAPARDNVTVSGNTITVEYNDEIRGEDRYDFSLPLNETPTDIPSCSVNP